MDISELMETNAFYSRKSSLCFFSYACGCRCVTLLPRGGERRKEQERAGPAEDL